MPLHQGKSKKAFSENVAIEMKHGKPQNQALAISYAVKRKNAKKKASGGTVESGSRDMNMAEGGEVNVKQQKRPMPDNTYNDSKDVAQNRGNKPPKNDQWTDNPTIKQAQSNTSRKVMPIKHPKMVPQSGYTTRLRDEEDDLQSSARPGPYDEQPPAHDNEEGPNRQGPAVRDMAPEHSTHSAPYVKEIEDQYAQDMAEANMKRSNSYAKGGEVESSDYDHPANKYEHDFIHAPGPENEEGPNRQGPAISDTEEAHSLSSRMLHDDKENEDHEMEMSPTKGHSPDDSEDQPHDEEEMEHEDSLAAALMAKETRMALGGEILHDADEPLSHGSMDSDDSDQADLSRNADEDANEEDQASSMALSKENYSETDGLNQLDNPSDSAQTGDEEESESENKYDKIDRMRSKMTRNRQFKQR